jgi:ribonuclease BN (tRNA processing enzyme)
LGDAIMSEGRASDLSLLLSHFHWDHIQGLPFFVPAYVPSTKLAIFGPGGKSGAVRESLSRQMSAPHFPVTLGDLRASIEWNDLANGQSFQVGEARVTAAKLNHPGGVFAYRIEHGGDALVYATDTEHYACVDPALRALAEGANLLIYDAQYTPDEYRTKVGWGHSTYVAGVEIARAAGVQRLALYHHDPRRSDAGVAAIEASARELFDRTFAATEGLVVDTSGGEELTPDSHPDGRQLRAA